MLPDVRAGTMVGSNLVFNFTGLCLWNGRQQLTVLHCKIHLTDMNLDVSMYPGNLVINLHHHSVRRFNHIHFIHIGESDFRQAYHRFIHGQFFLPVLGSPTHSQLLTNIQRRQQVAATILRGTFSVIGVAMNPGARAFTRTQAPPVTIQTFPFKFIIHFLTFITFQPHCTVAAAHTKPSPAPTITTVSPFLILPAFSPSTSDITWSF